MAARLRNAKEGGGTPRDPDRVSMEFPEGRKLRSSGETQGSGTRKALTFFIAGILLGAVAMGSGYVLAGLQTTAAPPPQAGVDVTFELKALITGYVGVGGAIDGVRNPALLVGVGDRVEIVVTNGEDVEHNVAIDEFSMDGRHVFRIGEKATVIFIADREGTFAYYCVLPGHRAAGMEGELVVGQGGSALRPGPAKAVDVPYIARDPTDIPPPITRSLSATVHLYMEAKEVVAEIEEGTTFTYWTFNGTVPGPFFRVRVNDTVFVHFRNAATSTMDHSVDFHAVTGPGGGAVAVQTPPGQETSFKFKALNPGIFVYHCASPHIPTHIAMGMYGLILVEPEGGLPPVDREYYIMQGDIYTKWAPGTAGHQEFDGAKMRNEEPEYVVFNGRFMGLTGDHALTASVGETIRMYVGVGGPNLMSSFHIIGEIFDRVYIQGDLVSPPKQSVQTTIVAPGAALAVEFAVEVPGNFILVDHAIVRAIDKGAIGILTVSGPDNPDVFEP